MRLAELLERAQEVSGTARTQLRRVADANALGDADDFWAALARHLEAPGERPDFLPWKPYTASEALKNLARLAQAEPVREGILAAHPQAFYDSLLVRMRARAKELSSSHDRHKNAQRAAREAAAARDEPGGGAQEDDSETSSDDPDEQPRGELERLRERLVAADGLWQRRCNRLARSCKDAFRAFRELAQEDLAGMRAVLVPDNDPVRHALLDQLWRMMDKSLSLAEAGLDAAAARGLADG